MSHAQTRINTQSLELAAVISRQIAGWLRADGVDPPSVILRYGRLKRIHLAVWLGVSTCTVFGLGWPQLVRCNWQLGRAFLIDDVLMRFHRRVGLLNAAFVAIAASPLVGLLLVG